MNSIRSSFKVAGYVWLTLFLTGALFAQKTQIDGPEYTTKTVLSYSNSQGNTQTSQLGLDFHGERKHESNTMKLDFDALQSSSSGVENQNKWLAAWQYDRVLSDVMFFNYILSYGEDKFSGFDYQFNTGPGCGYKAINTEIHKLDLRANALYSKDKIAGGGTNEYASWIFGLGYKWKILDNLKLSENASFKSQFDAFENYFISSKTSVENKINGHFSLGMSYKVDYKNIPAEGRKRTDRVFLASFIINY